MEQLQFRSDNQIQSNKLNGYASVFDSYARLPGHYERIDRSAFRDVLNDDVVALFNHDANYPLARTDAGLKLSVDSQGLHYEIDLPDTQVARDLRELVDRGVITGSSFGFIPDEDQWEKRAGKQIRTHLRIERLVDVSPVVFPAYPGTSVGNRKTTKARLIRVRHNIRNNFNA